MVTGELWICADSASGMDVMWKINNFFQRSWKPGDSITSREFNFGSYSCKISSLPGGTKQKSEFISFCVMCFCRNRPKMKLGFQLTLNTDNGALGGSASRKEIHETRDAIIYICDFPLQDIIGGKEGISPAVLTVSCKLNIERIPEEQALIPVHVEADTNTEATVNEESETVSPAQSSPCDGLIPDFAMLSVNGNDSDVTIKVMGENFGAHKSIFAARAPVFAAVLQQKLMTTDTDTVTINDLCGVSAFRAFLHFVYKGEVGNISIETAFELYVLADKYNLDELKQLCLKFTKREEYVPIILAA